MRIALSSTYSWPEVRRGGERYLHELAAALVDAGHEVRILSTGVTPSRDRVLGVPVRRLRRRRVLGGLADGLGDQFVFGAQSLLTLGPGRFDVWHALTVPDGAAATVSALLRPGLTSVFTAIGLPDPSTLAERPDRRLHRFVVDHVDAYLCISATAGRYLQEGFGREPIVLTPGVDVDRFRPAPRRNPEPTLLFAANNLVPRKNLPLLLEAVALLRRRRPRVELWLLGPGDPGPLIRRAPSLAREAVTVAHLADQEELRWRYGRAWVTVLPAVEEAFGMVVIESLASGTPAVVRVDGGGPTEIVQPGTGVIAGTSAQDLADACHEALDLAQDPATTRRCRELASRYDWRCEIVPRLERVYLAGGRP